MTLSKRHYIAIANLLRNSLDLANFTDKLITYMKMDNERFDPQTFREATNHD